MTAFRILLERVLYILATLGMFYGGIAKTDPDTGESADSLINMINGSFPFDSSIFCTLIFFVSRLFSYSTCIFASGKRL